MNYSVILLAAGSGKRMNLGYNKVFLKMNGVPVLVLSTTHFFNDPNCREIIFVTNTDELVLIEALLKEHQLFDERCKFIPGGKERQHSVFNGLSMVSLDLVLVHDIARPFIKSTLIEQLCNAAREFGCAVPGVKLKDTIKKVTDDFVNHTLDRNQLYAIQTPQACLTKIINDAHHLAQINRFLGTDEASLVETFNLSPVKVVLGDYDNIKLTTPEDIQYAHTLFNKYF